MATPPSDLGPSGKQLWSDITRDHDVRAAGQLATLAQACKAFDRAELCAARIAQDGQVVESRNGLKDHPLLRHEAVARALMCRLLSRMNIVGEAKRRPGRPGSGGLGITAEYLENLHRT